MPQQEYTSLIIAGKEYGTGSARDWAAKGTALLGVRVVIAESFERIHRSNLIGMGVLPLQFMAGEGHRSLGLTANEIYTIRGLSDLIPHQILSVVARSVEGKEKVFTAQVRLDTEAELKYYKQGGILQTVFSRMACSLQDMLF